MINVPKAWQLVIENCPAPKIKRLPLSEASGTILAEAVYAAIDTPPFHQAAYDGYAFSFDKWNKISPLKLNGEIQTGNYSNKPVQANEAVRIFTGAAVPPGADTVVMQENVMVNGNLIVIQDTELVKGSNVRLQGSQTKKAEIALQQEQLLTPAGISYLAGIGVNDVKVFSKPAVSIIITGKELIKPGSQIAKGKIFESNSAGLVAALQQLGISPVSVEVVDDREEEIEQAVSKQLQADILILTGGVSVGDYDLVPASLEKCGIKKVFHKVKQKPGKPLFFGVHEQTLVFALPGNPAAVLSCFYKYVVPAISCFTHKNYFKKLLLPLVGDFYKKPGLTYFAKGRTGAKSVTILGDQESHSLNSFAVADCLVELEEAKEYYIKGDFVNVSMII